MSREARRQTDKRYDLSPQGILSFVFSILTFKEVSEVIGVNESSVNRWKDQKSTPTRGEHQETLAKVAAVGRYVLENTDAEAERDIGDFLRSYRIDEEKLEPVRNLDDLKSGNFPMVIRAAIEHFGIKST